MAVVKLTEGSDYDKSFYDMVKGIARKASNKLPNRDTDDIEQDLWVKILDAEERKGKSLDPGLAAKICWDYITDMQRQDIRRQSHIAMDVDPEFIDYLDTSDSDDEGGKSAPSPVGAKRDNGDYLADIAIRDLYDRFPIGSKERMYLDFWGNATDVMPNDRMVPDASRQKDGYSENTLAKMLGYASQASGGYRKFKKKMQDIVRDYLG